VLVTSIGQSLDAFRFSSWCGAGIAFKYDARAETRSPSKTVFLAVGAGLKVLARPASPSRRACPPQALGRSRTRIYVVVLPRGEERPAPPTAHRAAPPRPLIIRETARRRDVRRHRQGRQHSALTIDNVINLQQPLRRCSPAADHPRATAMHLTGLPWGEHVPDGRLFALALLALCLCILALAPGGIAATCAPCRCASMSPARAANRPRQADHATSAQVGGACWPRPLARAAPDPPNGSGSLATSGPPPSASRRGCSRAPLARCGRVVVECMAIRPKGVGK
jgi:hypothetical protein